MIFKSANVLKTNLWLFLVALARPYLITSSFCCKASGKDIPRNGLTCSTLGTLTFLSAATRALTLASWMLPP
jgi:hypothetical protein